MLTVQLLTKNHSKEVRKAIESVTLLKPRILVGDLGSTDGTEQVCLEMGAEVYPMGSATRDEARNRLAAKVDEGINLWMEPWEAVMHGHQVLGTFNGTVGYATVLQGNVLSQDIRLWRGKQRFVNPVFERIEAPTAAFTPVMLYSKGGPDPDDTLKAIEQWKTSFPLSPTPYYYQSCVLMAQGNYPEFLKIAEHFLITQREITMPTVMTRYYFAMVQMLHKRAYRAALQNINLCLCARPLMAEFWCLMADVYYHLLRRFDQAKEFYENAMILGSRRLRDDLWPMDIAKYRAYPEKMIASCDAILNHKDFFVKIG